ncbi:protein of unknown function DUF323 [Desulfatibacillum aliphaticivorans]|uniref:Sulfatase-modifying factor enzyme-like domain-containing protein n=1 Tax=Desulfatibacillum aliphaticivorans TaxID=218208 RepID=B8FLB2_DESAL|nr:formylglycine-generating enzyme family protein [Desulfatibacillum aliphaticivorans]ACL05058.1 protein of unknown function DUF323 [Desulfatibacillum aliphaticivorans]
MKKRISIFTVGCVVAVVGLLLSPANLFAGQNEFTDSSGMEFVKIEAGAFTMGAPEGEEFEDAQPEHKITITKPFYMGKYEVTRKQWAEIMGQDASKLSNPNNPVEQVSYADVELFLLKLNEKEGTKTYRLPTEAEWEYAARAGTAAAYFFGDDASRLGEYAWYYGNSKFTNPVGRLKPNPWGLYDIYGNVFEWCQDYYGQDYYKDAPSVDPKGFQPDVKVKKTARVIRGGGWYSKAKFCSSAYRSNSLSPQKFIGLRLVKDIE